MNSHAPALSANDVPWYRQPWPWLLLSGPAVVVVAGLATAYLAVRSDDGLVAQDYYKRGLLINAQLSKSDRASNIAALASFGRDGSVRVQLSGAGDIAPAQLRLRVSHPTRDGADLAVALGRTSDGSYVGQIVPVAAGRWLVTVDTDTWRLPSAEVMAPFNVLRLGASVER